MTTTSPAKERTRHRRTAAVLVAAVLACIYACVLIGLAVTLTIAWAGGRGVVGNLGSNAANRGVAFFIVACVAGAAALVFGAVRAWRGRRGFAAIVPLAIVVLVGCIGEPIDILSGNPPLNNLIGAAIIVAAALPLVLLLLPRRARAQAGSVIS
jgi:FtsH-binding integral membrane protein